MKSAKCSRIFQKVWDEVHSQTMATIMGPFDQGLSCVPKMALPNSGPLGSSPVIVMDIEDVVR